MTLNKILSFLGIDYHIGFTLISRFWSIFAGGIVLIFIPVFLSEAEQGYYFTFSSLIAAQVFFELGFNFVIIQIVGHEMAGVRYYRNKGLIGNHYNISRLTNLISLLKKWYLSIAILFFIMISIAGFYFFSSNGKLDFKNWFLAWILLVLFSSLNLFISPFLSILEGMGLVGQVAKLRFIQSMIGYLGLFIFLIFGAGLLSIPLISGSAAICSLFWIYNRHRKLIFPNHEAENVVNLKEKISWKKEIFPFQWKIALSWLSGYFIFQLFNPLIFANQGEIEAGKLGLTLTVFTTMLSLSMSWVTAKSPIMAKLIAERKFTELNSLFRAVTIKSGIANISISIVFIVMVLILREANISIAERLANTHILFLLLCVSIVNHFIFSAATYMRAHKKEPMIWNSLCTGFLIAPTIYFLSKISSTATIAGYAVILILVCLPWTIIIYLKFVKANQSKINN